MASKSFSLNELFDLSPEEAVRTFLAEAQAGHAGNVETFMEMMHLGNVPKGLAESITAAINAVSGGRGEAIANTLTVLLDLRWTVIPYAPDFTQLDFARWERNARKVNNHRALAVITQAKADHKPT